jgi:exodeoxyribonuclease V gamma subunit
MTSFRLVTGSSPNALLARLDDDARAAALSAFDDETIVVQSLGMERWVRQQLALRRGAAASLRLPFPAAFCRGLAAAMHPTTASAALDPRFDEQALTWRLSAILDDATFADDPINAPLATYLAGADAPKRYALARRIGARFDEYRLYRPDLLLAWERGESAGPASPHTAWQASCWRRLTRGESPMHFARWFTGAIETLEAARVAPASLPPRVAVFGVSTLPPLFVRLLRALARFVPVTCYVLTPSASGWRDGADRHALETAFGGTSRALLADLTTNAGPVEHLVSASAPSADDTLLAHLQHALRNPPTSVPTRARIARSDHSLLVHECHSPVRELEVLRDQLLDAFAADPTLRPHDVLVMVPDVEVYAPLAAMVFGTAHGGARATGGEPAVIPYRLADRALDRDASAAQALGLLLDLAGSRFLASAVLDLLTLAPVQQAAGIAPAQLDQITHWVHEAGIRWGRDGLDRGAHDLPSLEDFTWRQGLDRLLAGYATGRIDALVEGVLPVAGDTIGEAELLGRFAEWAEGLFAQLAALEAPRPLLAWSRTLQDALAWLVRPDTPEEQVAYDRVQRELVQLARTAGDQLGEAVSRDIPFEVARQWLGGALSGDQHDTGFLTGGLTICAMKPMRAIPFTVIAVLGLGDRDFPRRERRAAFDLIEVEPRAGDRQPKADDRQLVLDTLLCAGSRLHLSWVGRSQQNNAEIAPSVVVSELLDVLDAHYETERDDPTRTSGEPPSATRPARAHVLVSHFLQPFHVAYFTGADDRRFSFDSRWARSVEAAQQRHEPPPFHRTQVVALPPLDAAAPLVIELQALMDAWCNPARFHCLQRLLLRVPGADGGIEDVEPVGVAGLAKYQIQQSMLDRALARRGAAPLDRDAESRLTAAAGQLPPGALGPLWYAGLRKEFDDFLAPLGPLAFHDPLAVRIDGPGWRLVGRLEGQVDGAQLRLRAARVGLNDRVQGWIAHCAYAAIGGEGPTRLRGLKEDTGYAPLEATGAVAVLDTLVAAYRHLQVAPLPYFPEAGAAYWRAFDNPPRAESLARDAFAQSNDWRRADISDPHVALLWRGRDPFSERLHEFVSWCETLWGPLSDREGAYKSASSGAGARA